MNKKAITWPYLVAGLVTLAVILIAAARFAPMISQQSNVVINTAQEYALTKSEGDALNNARRMVTEFLDDNFHRNHGFTNEKDISQYAANVTNRIVAEQGNVERSQTINTPFLVKQFQDLKYELISVNQPYAVGNLYFYQKNRDGAVKKFNEVAAQNEKFVGVAKAKQKLAILACNLDETQCKVNKDWCYYNINWYGNKCVPFTGCSQFQTIDECKSYGCFASIKYQEAAKGPEQALDKCEDMKAYCAGVKSAAIQSCSVAYAFNIDACHSNTCNVSAECFVASRTDYLQGPAKTIGGGNYAVPFCYDCASIKCANLDKDSCTGTNMKKCGLSCQWVMMGDGSMKCQ